MDEKLSFKKIRELLENSHRCYALWICRKECEQSYCKSHKKHHRYWVYPTIEINPRPWWGFDTKKELVEFVIREFQEKK